MLNIVLTYNGRWSRSQCHELSQPISCSVIPVGCQWSHMASLTFCGLALGLHLAIQLAFSSATPPAVHMLENDFPPHTASSHFHASTILYSSTCWILYLWQGIFSDQKEKSRQLTFLLKAGRNVASLCSSLLFQCPRAPKRDLDPVKLSIVQITSTETSTPESLQSMN